MTQIQWTKTNWIAYSQRIIRDKSNFLNRKRRNPCFAQRHLQFRVFSSQKMAFSVTTEWLQSRHSVCTAGHKEIRFNSWRGRLKIDPNPAKFHSGYLPTYEIKFTLENPKEWVGVVRLSHFKVTRKLYCNFQFFNYLRIRCAIFGKFG